jgi:hypothetical protein
MSLILSGTDGLSDIDGTAATPAIRGTDANTGIFFPAADTIAFSEGGVEAARFDSAGNLGIGTTSPLRLLQVGAYGVTNGEIALGATTTGYNSILFGDGATGSDVYRGYVQYNHTSDAMLFATAAAEQARINSSGNLGIGTTSPAARLQVLGFGATGQGAADTYTLMYESTTQGNGAGLWFGAMSTENTGVIGSTTGSGNIAFQTYDGAWAERMRITNVGALILVGSTAQKATGTTWSNPSDKRLKDNIRDYTKGTGELMQVRVREWEYNGKGGTTEGMKGLGVVADEVMTVLPNTVENYDAKFNANDEETTAIKKFDATEITWLLVKTVQEQQALITQLTTRITALETP